MDDLDRLRSEDSLQELEAPRSSAPPPSRAPWYLLLIFAIAIGAGLWWWARTSPVPLTSSTARQSPAAEPLAPVTSTHGLGVGEPDPNAPGLSELDAYVRPLLSALSARPELAA